MVILYHTHVTHTCSQNYKLMTNLEIELKLYTLVFFHFESLFHHLWFIFYDHLSLHYLLGTFLTLALFVCVS